MNISSSSSRSSSAFVVPQDSLRIFGSEIGIETLLANDVVMVTFGTALVTVDWHLIAEFIIILIVAPDAKRLEHIIFFDFR